MYIICTENRLELSIGISFALEFQLSGPPDSVARIDHVYNLQFQKLPPQLHGITT